MAGAGVRQAAGGGALLVLLLAALATARCSGDSGDCGPNDLACICARDPGDPRCGQAQCTIDRRCGDACCDPSQACVDGQCVAGDFECVFIPGPGDFEAPGVIWWWPYLDTAGQQRRPIDMGDFDQVMSTPAVVRLGGPGRPDDPPAVVFNSFRIGADENVEGVLRAVRGDTGEPLWTVTDPALRTNGLGSVAVGDLDGDGIPEIVTGGWDTSGGLYGGMLAFRADGSLLWRVPGLRVGWGGAAIANLDGTGPAEVVIGSAVIDGATGRLRCPPRSGHNGRNHGGPLSAAVDIDADGRLEIVTGNQVYKLETDASGADTCRPLWPQITYADGSPAPDGFPAVADLFDDPAMPATVGHPEIAVVSRGFLRVHDWTGGLVVNPLPLPGGGDGGAPTIADFDGDGRAEIGVAGALAYTVFKPGLPGGVLWSVPIQDSTSSVTASSVFDFDGNGRAEVVYADECYVHVFDGMVGMEIFNAENTSCTALETPVVADADGDAAAELLVPQNSVCGVQCPYGGGKKLGRRGLRAFKSQTDAWVATRPVWNQHTFHGTNVGDAGEIPALEERSWGPNTRNSFRQNYQGTGTFAAPDLHVVRTRLDGTACPTSLRIVAEVANKGSRAVRPGLPVSFYKSTDAGPVLLGVANVAVRLRPGERAEASIEWKGPPRINPVQVMVRVNDPGTGRVVHRECNENDDTADVGAVMCYEAG